VRLAAAAFLLAVLCLGLVSSPALAAGPPQLGASWSLSVLNESARLDAEINPNGLPTSFHFDYITNAAYEANLAAAKNGFIGTSRTPSVNDVNIGSGSAMITITAQLLAGLPAGTAFRYRVVAHNSAGTATGQPFLFATHPSSSPPLPDGRGWEMVSPVDKNGGGVQAPETIAGGGVTQAASQGGSVTYSSTASFAGGAGAPPASQYIATRGSGGWFTQNITQPLFSGSYDATDQGVPFQLFSADLGRGLLLNGDHCRGEATGCAVANPPLPGTDAPVGYQDYYLREGASFTALLGNANGGFLTLGPAHFDLRLAGTSPDLRHPVLSTCAKLSSNATEVALGEGCEPEETNLYEYSPGSGLSLVNLLPAQSTGTPGASLAAQAGAVSDDGSRVYFIQGGTLYLREGAQTKLLAAGGEFQTASVDGTTAFYTLPDEHLYRYQTVGAGTSTDLTPSGGVKGVLGASTSGDTVYYQDGSALKRWHSGTTTTVAAGAKAAEEGDWPPVTGTARVSADGAKLLFTSKESLSGYDNTDLETKALDAEVFRYDAGAVTPLVCISCNLTGERPLGSSSIPGAIADGSAEGSTDSYKPRVLSANGQRIFFESRDALTLTDINSTSPDVYEWEAQGEGSCIKAGGCVSLVSSGNFGGGASFADASADGADVFFLTGASLVPADPGSVDLYASSVAGGFPEPTPPIPCEGDACQPLPSPPVDPTLTTLLSGHGNPPVRYPGVKCKKGFVKRKGECVRKTTKKHHRKKQKHSQGGGGGR
jgi:hypothetical protein